MGIEGKEVAREGVRMGSVEDCEIIVARVEAGGTLECDMVEEGLSTCSGSSVFFSSRC